MSMFQTLAISQSGLMTHRKWLDATADNIANINTVRRTDEDAFQARLVVAQAVDYGSGEGGVRVAGADRGRAADRAHAHRHDAAERAGHQRFPSCRAAW